jgi:hypothetical protein
MHRIVTADVEKSLTRIDSTHGASARVSEVSGSFFATPAGILVKLPQACGDCCTPP